MIREEVNRDIEEIAEILQSDVDAETKCKMISNILSAKPHYFEVEQDLCKNCIFGEGTVYCREHCPYEAKTEQESCDEWQNGYLQGVENTVKEFKYELDRIRCDDAISREALLKKQYRIDDSATLSTRDVVNVEDIEDAPLVTLCKDTISRMLAQEEITKKH